MAQQIKKKFLSPEVIEYFDNQIDAVEQSVLTEKSRAEGQEAAIRSEFAAADAILDQKIDGNFAIFETDIDLVRSDITANTGAIAQEVLDRQAGDSALDARITTLEGQVGEDLQSAITALQAADSAEQSAREAADLVLDGKIETEKARIDAILSASSADKDSFAEIVSLINSVDTENDQAFASYVTSNNARVTDLEGVVQGNFDLQQTDIDLLRSDVEANSSAISQEVSDRQSGDSALDSRITTLEGQVSTDLQNAITQLQSDIASEATARENGDNSLDSRVSPIENREMFKKYSLYNDSAAVYSNGKAGVEDPSAITRDGWYVQNTSASDVIGWYFYDKNLSFSPAIQKQNFTAFAVMTLDAVGTNGAKPIFGVYSYPTGTNDAYPGYFHSRWSYQMSQTTLDALTAGKKILVYIGQNPEAHPELDHHELELVPYASLGEKLDTETVGFASFNSDTAPVNKVKWLVESLGVESPSYKQESTLKIRHAVKSVIEASLTAEETARVAADSNLQSQIDALNGAFATDSELASAVSSLESQISSESSSRQSADSALDARLQVVESKGFSKGSVVVGAELGFIDLDREYSIILSMSVGRLAVHENEDFTVSVVGGKTRVTWINSLANPSGEEKIETGDKVFFSGAY